MRLLDASRSPIMVRDLPDVTRTPAPTAIRRRERLRILFVLEPSVF
jgi:hypothetical protein